MNNKIEPWIQTFTGKKFWLTDPKPETIHIEDIAHALAMICRYNGHTKTHYSVAQHSVIVSNLVPKELALSGLLHDAAEAYIGDLTKPYKDLIYGEYAEYIEEKITKAIYDKFNCRPYHFDSPEAKEADLQVLRAEALHVLSNQPIENWHEFLPRKLIIIDEWDWKLAETLFIERFYELEVIL